MFRIHDQGGVEWGVQAKAATITRVSPPGILRSSGSGSGESLRRDRLRAGIEVSSSQERRLATSGVNVQCQGTRQIICLANEDFRQHAEKAQERAHEALEKAPQGIPLLNPKKSHAADSPKIYELSRGSPGSL